MQIERQEGRFRAPDGTALYYRRWKPQVAEQGEMVIVHGAFEHSGRCLHVGQFFAEQGFDVRILDHRGFGQSEGHRCYIDRFDQYIEDLHHFVTMTGERPVLIGHSMGGLIAFRYALAHCETIRAVIVSSPWFREKVKASPILKVLAPVFSALLPRLHLVKVPPLQATANQEVNHRTAADPFFWDRPTPRWYVELTRAADACLHCGELKVPLLYLQGGQDLLVSVEHGRQVFDRLQAPHKEYKLYPARYHEIFNDPQPEEVFQEILQWLETHQLCRSNGVKDTQP